MVKPELDIGSLQSYFYLKTLSKFWHEVKFSVGSHKGTSKNGTSQNGTSHNGTLQNGTLRKGTLHNGTLQKGTLQNGTSHNGTLQNGKLQNGTLQNGTSHNGTASQNGTRCKRYVTKPYSYITVNVTKRYSVTKRYVTENGNSTL
jgi:hypothetical protein